MDKYEDDLDLSLKLCNTASKAIGGEQRKADKKNDNDQAVASSSWRINIDLNKLPSNSEADDKERANHENHNEAVSFSSSLRINIDLNMPPSEYETRWPSLSLSCCSIRENTPNPNPQSSPPNGKRRRNGGNKKAKRPRRKAALEVDEASPPPTPAWLVQVMKDMKVEEDARFIFKKTLTATDVKPSQSRLLIPFEQVIGNDFLTPAESSFIAQEADKKPALEASIVSQRSETLRVKLKRWNMKKKDSENGTLNYVLNNGWNKVVEANGLKAGDNINLWSFRQEGVICFAIVTLPPTMN